MVVKPAKTKARTRRRKGEPTKAQELQSRREWVLAEVQKGVRVDKLFRTGCAHWQVSSVTLRRDLRWAGDQIERDLGAAAKSEPVRIYHRLAEVAEVGLDAGKGAPIILPGGEVLMGADKEPVLMPDAKFLGVAVKALVAQSTIMGYRTSAAYRKQLEWRANKIGDAEIRLKEAQAGLAEAESRSAEREEALADRQRELAAAREAKGGAGEIQELEEDDAARLARAMLLGKVDLSGYLTLHSRSASVGRRESRDGRRKDDDGGPDGPGEIVGEDGGEGAGAGAGCGSGDGGAGGDGDGGGGPA